MAKMTDTEKLNLLIRDDPEISGKMYARMKMHINEATVVDAVPVVPGRWYDFSDDRHHWKRMDLRCSICHKRASSFVGGSEDWWDSYKPNYCPNCGAKMDGERKDNG